MRLTHVPQNGQHICPLRIFDHLPCVVSEFRAVDAGRPAAPNTLNSSRDATWDFVAHEISA